MYVVIVFSLLHINRFLLGRHKLAIEAYTQAEAKCEKPDWEIHHNLGVYFSTFHKIIKIKFNLIIFL